MKREPPVVEVGGSAGRVSVGLLIGGISSQGRASRNSLRDSLPCVCIKLLTWRRQGVQGGRRICKSSISTLNILVEPYAGGDAWQYGGRGSPMPKRLAKKPHRNNQPCDGSENLAVDGRQVAFQWHAWWNGYAFTLSRQRFRLVIIFEYGPVWVLRLDEPSRGAGRLGPELSNPSIDR
jgi:hypothetical protein